ncbi:MAG: phosphatidylglycerophosphatase A [Opitutae bacterium]|nr:phosphatidylglycerophosphatase A [Opitutae bacterium]
MDRLILFAATLGPIGRKLPAPGTFGSLAGLLVFWLLIFPANIEPLFVLSAFAILALCAIPLCGKAEILLSKEDPKEVILDEFVAQPLVFVGVPWSSYSYSFDTVLLLGLGFALFRFFDIMKPLGISRLQSIPGGAGVVVDDIAAAIPAGLGIWLLWGNGIIS